ncbi:MAG: 4-alpha-glucanotransferase [Candidatus Cloacimonadota bacterium]|jgi:4-alpha-glucanotransferase|nr:4-alpha-glucanotransferase [Candidatus Cloacimonadota bacterium]
MKFERASGILMHITSLPGDHGIGSLGKSAFDFIDFLVAAKQKLWQIFPLGPTGYGDSPYQTFSVFAGNPLLIDMQDLIKRGLLAQKDLENMPANTASVDFGAVFKAKHQVLQKAYQKFTATSEYEEFCKQNNFWLENYATFMAIKDNKNGQPWNKWDEKLKQRDFGKLQEIKTNLAKQIGYYKFLQYIFYDQWRKIQDYAHSKNIKIIGDIPIYVAFDSADAWANPEYFLFDENKQPTHVAGVPPDAFTETGQLWGNPLYDWKTMQEDGFKWWINRFKITLSCCDIIRLDHFLGLVNYWAVPAEDDTAINGTWQPALGREMLEAVLKALGELPVIAEDLGAVTPPVEQLRDDFNLPGMKILQFAFGSGDDNPFLPHNFPENCVVYTGTHDNETTRGWYENIPQPVKDHLHHYLQFDGSNVAWKLIETAWHSRAVMALAPMQDFLNLDNSARMNTPGTLGDNWKWRVLPEQLSPELQNKIAELTTAAGR